MSNQLNNWFWKPRVLKPAPLNLWSISFNFSTLDIAKYFPILSLASLSSSAYFLSFFYHKQLPSVFWFPPINSFALFTFNWLTFLLMWCFLQFTLTNNLIYITEMNWIKILRASYYRILIKYIFYLHLFCRKKL